MNFQMGSHEKYRLISMVNYIRLFLLPVIAVVAPDPILDYCEFGYCEPDEYCCGKDMCCKETSEMWYFWVGIMLVIATIVIVTSVKYFLRKIEISRSATRHYEPVPNQIVEET